MQQLQSFLVNTNNTIIRNVYYLLLQTQKFNLTHQTSVIQNKTNEYHQKQILLKCY